MAHVSDLIATDIEQYLKAHENKSLLRFITCGSVDDGKSTLIGRLLYESKMLFEDQLAAVEADRAEARHHEAGVVPEVLPPLRLRLRGDCSSQSDTSGACQRGGPPLETGAGSMSFNDAHAFAFSLATTLMAAIIIFQAGDGTLSVTPASEYDGDIAAIVHEIDPFAP